MNLQEQILALLPKNEHHYLWPGEKAAYRAGCAEMKDAAAALVAGSEAQGEHHKEFAVKHGEALQRAGHAAGLLAGADLHRNLVPAIEALRGQADEKLREALELASSHIDPTLSGDLYREVQAKIDTALAALPAPEVKS